MNKYHNLAATHIQLVYYLECFYKSLIMMMIIIIIIIMMMMIIMIMIMLIVYTNTKH